MDSNFGATAGIAEMLLQSHDRADDGGYVIHLLPALPKSWPTGSALGLRARGGFIVDQKWKDGRLVAAKITSLLGQPVTLRHGGKTQSITLAKDASFVFQP
jgi:alpha-L-fucosidase 2